MNLQREVDHIMREAGAVLLRHNKHKVWRLPNGRLVVTALTPRNRSAAIRNVKRDIQNQRKADLPPAPYRCVVTQ